MFSEDNILNYCGQCRKCDEVRHCPLRAEAEQRERKFFIPLSANGMVIKNKSLLAHVDLGGLTIPELKDYHTALNNRLLNDDTRN